MPTYEIESGGQVLEIDSEQPPTPKDIQAALRALAPKVAPNTERRIAGQVVRTPWEGFKAIVNGYAPASVRVEEELAKPAAPLRDLPDFEASPNLPSQLAATAGNVVKETAQMLSAPSNFPIVTGMGALATAGRMVPSVLPLAKKGLVAAQAGFAAQMAPAAVEATKRAQTVRNDPQATDLERSEATRDAVMAGGMTLLAALGAIHEIRPALARELKGAKPVDAVAKIREEAARAKDAAERATLESTADALDERYTQPVERVSDLPPQLALDERYFAPRETVLNVEPTLALDERYSATPEAVPAVAEMPAAPVGPLAEVAPKAVASDNFGIGAKKMTPMIEQWLGIKKANPDSIVLFRLGDFYETFGDDAAKTAKTLNVTLTSRQGTPMAGIPFHSLDAYAKKLADAGHKVAIVDEVPSANKGALSEVAPKPKRTRKAKMPLAEEPRVEAVHEAPAPEAPASAAVEPVRSLDDPKPAEPTQSAPSSAAKAEEQMDLLTVDHPKAPVSARINQKITDLEALKARVEANEEFPPSVVAAYEKRAKEAAARLDAFKDEQSPEWSRAYDENETAQGDFKAVSENALSDGIDLIDSKIALYAKRKAVVDAARVKDALTEGRLDAIEKKAKAGPLSEVRQVPEPTPVADLVARDVLERHIDTLEMRMKQDKARSITRPEDVARLAKLKEQLAATKQPEVATKGKEVADYPTPPSLPDKGDGGRDIFRAFHDASEKWRSDVAEWIKGKPEGKAIIWEESANKYSPGNVKALSRNIGDSDNPWRVTTFWPNDGKLIPSGHQVYKTRAAAMIEEGKHIGKIHDRLPGSVMTEQEIQGWKLKGDLAPDAPLFRYKLSISDQLLRERSRGSQLIENLVVDSLDDTGTIAFTKPVDKKHWEYLGLSEVAPVSLAEKPLATAPAPKTALPLAEVPATVAPAPDGGKVIAPTPAAERRVSTFADKKKIKVQREFLGDALKQAAKDAPDELAWSDEGRADMAIPLSGSGTPDSIAAAKANIEALNKKYTGKFPVHRKDTFDANATIHQAIRNRHAEHITIEVPDDGTFRIPNSKEHIAAFAENVQSKFGKKTASLPSPFSDPVKTNEAPSASGIGKLAKKPTEADLAAASKLAVSDDPTREILKHVYADDGFAVSTDGRRLFLVAGGKGLNAAELKAEITKNNPKGGVTSFPNWRQVVPDYIKAEGGKIHVTNNAPKTKLTVDTKTALNQLNQAISVMDMDKPHPSVKIYDVGDGKLGLKSQNPKLGDYMSDGVTDASKTLTDVNPNLLHDALTAARLAGHEKITLYIMDEIGPVTTVGGDNFVAVTMPVRLQ